MEVADGNILVNEETVQNRETVFAIDGQIFADQLKTMDNERLLKKEK